MPDPLVHAIHAAVTSFYAEGVDVDLVVQTPLAADGKPQMLMSMVDSSVGLLNNLEELVPILIQLGLRHNAYKVFRQRTLDCFFIVLLYP